jgi:hypothetical protein
MGFAGGDTNLYRYAGNSYPNATDPSGLAADDEWGAGFQRGATRSAINMSVDLGEMVNPLLLGADPWGAYTHNNFTYALPGGLSRRMGDDLMAVVAADYAGYRDRRFSVVESGIAAFVSNAPFGSSAFSVAEMVTGESWHGRDYGRRLGAVDYGEKAVPVAVDVLTLGLMARAAFARAPAGAAGAVPARPVYSDAPPPGVFAETRYSWLTEHHGAGMAAANARPLVVDVGAFRLYAGAGMAKPAARPPLLPVAAAAELTAAPAQNLRTPEELVKTYQKLERQGADTTAFRTGVIEEVFEATGPRRPGDTLFEHLGVKLDRPLDLHTFSDAAGAKRSHIVYAFKDTNGNIVYTGRASGRGTPAEVLRDRISRGHAHWREGLTPEVVEVLPSKMAVQGAEEVYRLGYGEKGAALENADPALSYKTLDRAADSLAKLRVYRDVLRARAVSGK